jgi:hypothetical protein
MIKVLLVLLCLIRPFLAVLIDAQTVAGLRRKVHPGALGFFASVARAYPRRYLRHLPNRHRLRSLLSAEKDQLGRQLARGRPTPRAHGTQSLRR